MADEETSKEKQQEPETQTLVEKKPSLLKKIIILTIMLVILSSGVWITFKGLTSGKPEKEESVSKEEPGFIYSFDPVIVNVAGTQGSRYLKVTVGLEYNSEKLGDELKLRHLQLMDILNTVLSSKTMDQVVNIDERDNMKRDIRDKMNNLVINGQIKNIFFSDYVVQ